MKKIKEIFDAIPGVSFLYSRLWAAYHVARIRKMSNPEVFSYIHKHNAWKSSHSPSGPGSEPLQTRRIVEQLPALFRRYQIQSILDIPCGDFNWMRSVDLEAVQYVGADVVADLIEQNKRHENESIKFRRIDLLSDPLPRVDLIICRDCFVHFSLKEVRTALRNLVASGSSYLLTTTYPEHPENLDILTGLWRTLNLETPPFDFPVPLHSIVEGCTEDNCSLADKSLALWRVADIPKQLWQVDAQPPLQSRP